MFTIPLFKSVKISHSTYVGRPNIIKDIKREQQRKALIFSGLFTYTRSFMSFFLIHMKQGLNDKDNGFDQQYPLDSIYIKI